MNIYGIFFGHIDIQDLLALLGCYKPSKDDSICDYDISIDKIFEGKTSLMNATVKDLH